MKRIRVIGFVLLAAAVLLSACGGFTFTVTSSNNKATIEAKDAEAGDSVDTEPLHVAGGRTAVVESSLEKGQLQIDFVSVTVYERDGDTPDEVIEGDVLYTVTVGAGDRQQLDVAKGTYILRTKAVEDTAGKVEIRFEKK